jgi:hypothetical protein
MERFLRSLLSTPAIALAIMPIIKLPKSADLWKDSLLTEVCCARLLLRQQLHRDLRFIA